MAREYLEDHVDAMLISPKRPFTNISLDDFKMLNLSNSLEFDFGFAWKRNRMLPDDVKKYLEFMKNREASEFM